MQKDTIIEIPMSKSCVLMLYDSEIIRELPADLLARGLKRGKAIRRRRVFIARERQKDSKSDADGLVV